MSADARASSRRLKILVSAGGAQGGQGGGPGAESCQAARAGQAPARRGFRGRGGGQRGRGRGRGGWAGGGRRGGRCAARQESPPQEAGCGGGRGSGRGGRRDAGAKSSGSGCSLHPRPHAYYHHRPGAAARCAARFGTLWALLVVSRESGLGASRSSRGSRGLQPWNRNSEPGIEGYALGCGMAQPDQPASPLGLPTLSPPRRTPLGL